MAEDLYQLSMKKSLGYVFARSAHFQQIEQNEKIHLKFIKKTSLQRTQHKNKINQLFSENSRILTPQKNDFSLNHLQNLSEYQPKNSDDRDFNWSIRIIEKNINLEMEKTFKKTKTDLKPLIQRQLENKAIRNLTSFQCAFEEAQDKLIKKQTKFVKLQLPPIEGQQQTVSTYQSESNDTKSLNSLKNQFISKNPSQKLKKLFALDNSQINTTQDSLLRYRTNSDSQKKIKPIVDSARRENKLMYQKNQKLLSPYKELICQQMRGSLNPNEKEMFHLQNSIGVLTLFQEMKQSAPELKLFEFQKNKRFFALPLRQKTKKKVLENLLNNNNDDHIQGFVKEIWYEFANEEEAQDYLIRKDI